MAVTRCPNCGELSLTAVASCPGCGAAMAVVDVVEVAPTPRAAAAQEQRELHEWTMEGRRLLDGMLQRAGIPRSWQGTTLVTPEVEHDRVEEMVELVGVGDARVGLADDDQLDERDELDDDATDDRVDDDDDGAAPDDEPDAEVAYDLTGWSDLARGDLVAALAEAEVEHGWDDEGDLVVAVRDEARVDRLFEQLTFDGATDDLPADEALGEIDDDGLLVQETLSDLFVGADRLRGNPLDGTAARLVIDGRDRARSLRLPFGFERTQWQRILLASDEVAECFEPGGVDDDEVRERAAALRNLLRDVV